MKGLKGTLDAEGAGVEVAHRSLGTGRRARARSTLKMLDGALHFAEGVPQPCCGGARDEKCLVSRLDQSPRGSGGRSQIPSLLLLEPGLAAGRFGGSAFLFSGNPQHVLQETRQLPRDIRFLTVQSHLPDPGHLLGEGGQILAQQSRLVPCPVGSAGAKVAGSLF